MATARQKNMRDKKQLPPKKEAAGKKTEAEKKTAGEKLIYKMQKKVEVYAKNNDLKTVEYHYCVCLGYGDKNTFPGLIQNSLTNIKFLEDHINKMNAAGTHKHIVRVHIFENELETDKTKEHYNLAKNFFDKLEKDGHLITHNKDWRNSNKERLVAKESFDAYIKNPSFKQAIDALNKEDAVKFLANHPEFCEIQPCMDHFTEETIDVISLMNPRHSNIYANNHNVPVDKSKYVILLSEHSLCKIMYMFCGAESEKVKNANDLHYDNSGFWTHDLQELAVQNKIASTSSTSKINDMLMLNKAVSTSKNKNLKNNDSDEKKINQVTDKNKHDQSTLDSHLDGSEPKHKKQKTELSSSASDEDRSEKSKKKLKPSTTLAASSSNYSSANSVKDKDNRSRPVQSSSSTSSASSSNNSSPTRSNSSSPVRGDGSNNSPKPKNDGIDSLKPKDDSDSSKPTSNSNASKLLKKQDSTQAFTLFAIEFGAGLLEKSSPDKVGEVILSMWKFKRQPGGGVANT